MSRPSYRQILSRTPNRSSVLEGRSSVGLRDGWLPSDAAFEMYLATVKESDLSPYERDLYRHHRFNALKEKK